VSVSQKAALAGPFVVSALLVFLAVPVGRLLIDRITSTIRDANVRMNLKPTEIPAHVTPEYIGDYVDYTADVTGNISALVLVIAALLLVLIGGSDSWPDIVLASAGIPVGVIIMIKALGADPLTYNSKRRTQLQLSLPSVFVLLLNIAEIVLVFIQ
jgi:hypothetical protein